MPSRRDLLALALGAAQLAPAASLGVATADGDFHLNGANVRGNATLLDGALVETLAVPSQLQLAGGSVVRLEAGSRARIHAGRLVMEAGSGELRAAGPYALEARSLRIAADARAQARFALPSGSGAVQIAASLGRLRVMNAAGTLISRVEPGLALAFEAQLGGGASAPSSFIGCIVKKDGQLVLYDPTLKLIVEMRGLPAAIEREWGNRVQVNGTSPAAGQPEGRQLMDVTTITLIEIGGCEEMAKTAGAEVPAAASRPAPAAAVATSAPKAVAPAGGGGMSAGAKYGIIAAVVGGGAVAGIAAASGKRSR